MIPSDARTVEDPLIRTLALAAAVVVFGAPGGVALAQDYPLAGGALQEQLQHLRDHVAHDEAHRQIEEAHDRAHAEGFTSEAEHQAYHQGLQDLHGQVHDESPGTWHSHDDGGGYYGGRSYNSAPTYYGTTTYYRRPVYTTRYVTRYITRRYYRPVHHRRVYTYYRSY